MKKLILLLVLIASAVTAQAQRGGGYREFLEIGHNFGKPTDVYEWSDYAYYKYTNTNSIFLSTTHGYQFSQLVFIGGGVGIGLWEECIKIYESSDEYTDGGGASNSMWYGFVEARFDFLSASRISFYETNKIGIGGDIGTGDGGTLYFVPAVGAKYQINASFGLNLSLGYQIGPTTVESYQRLRGLTLSLGIDFQP